MEHTPAGAPAILVALQESGLGKAMRESLFLYPLTEIVHLIGIALLVGGIIALDLRLMGAHRYLPALAMARHLLPIAITGFCLALASGLLLFTTEAVSVAYNPAFLVKLSLIVLGGINAAVFHLGVWKRIAGWDTLPPPGAARLAGGVSLALWLGVLSCGRLIAYF